MEENNYEKELKKYKRKNVIMLIIVCILLFVVIYLYYFTSDVDFIKDCPGGNLEIEAFNAEWTSYEGTQSGLQVKALLTKLMANANTNQEVPIKILNIEFVGETDKKSINYNGDLNEYVLLTNEIYSTINPKSLYIVYINYLDTTELVNKIIISEKIKGEK